MIAMRLVDLDPRWLVRDGRRIGFTFRSPTGNEFRQSCFVVNVPTREQWDLFEQIHGEDWKVQGCKAECAWSIAGGIDAASFETLTVTPSIDGSAGGNWHGFITNGEIVG